MAANIRLIEQKLHRATRRAETTSLDIFSVLLVCEYLIRSLVDLTLWLDVMRQKAKSAAVQERVSSWTSYRHAAPLLNPFVGPICVVTKSESCTLPLA